LRLVIASATLDAEQLRNFFETNTTDDPSKDTTTIMSIEGRTFPVAIHYTVQVRINIASQNNTIMNIITAYPRLFPSNFGNSP